jgi:hypothetical protein
VSEGIKRDENGHTAALFTPMTVKYPQRGQRNQRESSDKEQQETNHMKRDVVNKQTNTPWRARRVASLMTHRPSSRHRGRTFRYFSV